MAGAGLDRFVAVRPGGTGNISDTHIVWETTTGLNEMPSPLYYRGRVYVVADGGRVTVFRPATGERLLDRQPVNAPGQYVGSHSRTVRNRKNVRAPGGAHRTGD
jgi:outer membrane protein assembly factor BamB